MKKLVLLALALFAVSTSLPAQSVVSNPPVCESMKGCQRPQFGERPKLVVGIVVDQMRWDYLSRYYSTLRSDGLRRLIDDGFSYNNCLINYVPTVTSIGHTSVYTGSTPAFHGICGNNFVENDRKLYCCSDDSVKTVGSDTRKGMMSPRNLLATTIGDQLRLHTDFRSKVVGVSYKDRAAILPAGHSATSAYWLDTKSGRFITSTYYMTELPQWVQDYNKELSKNKELKKVGERIGYYPLCGHITADMAIAALHGEQLGKGSDTDMLCVSFSQTDVIGHEWGTRGEHTDAAYHGLDEDVARLLAALDEQVGEGNYLVFLTADHGAAHNFQFMQDHKLHGGKYLSEEINKGLEKHLQEKFGNTEPLLVAELDCRYFFNHGLISSLGLSLSEVKREAVEYLRQQKAVSFVVDYGQVATSPIPAYLRERLANGYNYRRSGDIVVVPEPGHYLFGSWSSPVGTTHGEWNPYDAHIPLLFYGWKIPHGESPREVHIVDIAPTVCQLLHIQQPNACIGDALTFER